MIDLGDHKLDLTGRRADLGLVSKKTMLLLPYHHTAGGTWGRRAISFLAYA